MDIPICLDCEAWGKLIAAMIVLAAPVGLFVLRKRVSSAEGPWRLAGPALKFAAAASVPFAVIVLSWVVRSR